ncbi:MAG: UDP-2,3-diacylglucosamine diphosphatase LpxI [Verrucomicrobiota bacterium]|nr:UDP-2,3-diacylglucosamine diphosphatase LpxI [Verrucomicrobiota bacterium]
MKTPLPPSLAIIAGKGVYPRLLAESARKQGVFRIFAVAFRKETDPVIEKCADDVAWIHMGQLGGMLDALGRSGIRRAVMAGQITPTHLFRVRLDARMLALLKRLRARNAETIFGAVADEMKALGIELLPASAFMEDHMPEPGALTRRAPVETERHDIELGLKVADATSGIDIGQTVVVKHGTILAVEAFEGTDETIKRAGALGGAGSVVVKVAKRGHDMRFDIPVIGLHTVKILKKAKAAVLAIQAGRAIILEREKVVAEADQIGVAIVAVEAGKG